MERDEIDLTSVYDDRFIAECDQGQIALISCSKFVIYTLAAHARAVDSSRNSEKCCNHPITAKTVISNNHERLIDVNRKNCRDPVIFNGSNALQIPTSTH